MSSSFINATRIVPDLVPGTKVRWGHEKTPGDCRARARWEREQAEALKGYKFGPHLAEGHAQVVEGYERLADVREQLMLKVPEHVPGTVTPFGAERTIDDFRARAQWERERAQMLSEKIEGPVRLLAPAHLMNSQARWRSMR